MQRTTTLDPHRPFLKTAPLPASQRDEAFALQCAAQHELEVRVRELLTAHDGTDSFLDAAVQHDGMNPVLERIHFCSSAIDEGYVS